MTIVSTGSRSKSPMDFFHLALPLSPLSSWSKALVAVVPSSNLEGRRRTPSISHPHHFGDDALLKILPNRKDSDLEREGVEVRQGIERTERVTGKSEGRRRRDTATALIAFNFFSLAPLGSRSRLSMASPDPSPRQLQLPLLSNVATPIQPTRQ